MRAYAKLKTSVTIGFEERALSYDSIYGECFGIKNGFLDFGKVKIAISSVDVYLESEKRIGVVVNGNFLSLRNTFYTDLIKQSDDNFDENNNPR